VQERTFQKEKIDPRLQLEKVNHFKALKQKEEL
jgi:hypothetical protein